MTAGLSVARATANLNIYRATAQSAVSGFVKLHVGDPGVDGTANPSAVTTRNAITFDAPAEVSTTVAMELDALAAYAMTATETISHVSIWDAASGGNFVESWALDSGVDVVNGSALAFTVFTLVYQPIAA